ncbi:MAG: ABC transporter permease [Candidatus Promineifilaceae bacterium]
MGVIRYKIWQDLWSNKTRTLQVVLIIAVGAFAIGMIIYTRNNVIQAMQQSWIESSPPMIGMWNWPRITDDDIRSLKKIEGVVDVEGVAAESIEWRLDENQEWRPGGVTARTDFYDQHFAKLTLMNGRWPEENEIVVGQGTDTVFGAEAGKQVFFKTEGRDKVYTVVGTVSDPLALPPSFGGNAQYYISLDTYDELYGTRDYDRILAAAAEYDEPKVTALANKIRDRLERQDIDSGGNLPPNGGRTVDPSKHFFQDTMDGIFFVLGVMAALALFLGLFLVYNTINAVISQQVDQIGVMKAIGASSSQILWIYLAYIFAFGSLALVIAVPLGTVGGWTLSNFLLGSFNAQPEPISISWPAIWAQTFISLLAPLLVALVPILSGSRITVREAISTYGLSTSTSMLDRGAARLKRVSRLLLLTVTNTFRHKGRVTLTQLTLVLSGLIFMMVMSAGDSTTYTFNDLLFSILNSNINLVFEDAERIKYIEAITNQMPGVKDSEMWAFGNASGRLNSEDESDDDPSLMIFGVPPETKLYGYQMRDGRWLTANDVHSVVLNQNLAEDLGATVGDWVTVDLGVSGTVDWQVVGLLFDPILTNTALVPRDVLLREQNMVGRTNSIWIQTDKDDAQTEQIVVKRLRQFYEAKGIDVQPGGVINGQDTSSEVVEGINSQFQSIISLLAVMAVLIGVVGSISLSGVLSLGVIERQREIGVMRAIGASSWDISRLFIGEGLILGWLSWIIAMPLSLIAGRLMTEALSAALGVEIVYHYTPQGAIIWLAIITILAALASGLPARRATRLSVRESLAYQ